MLHIDEQMNISMTRGDTVQISISLTDNNGNAYDFSGDQEMVFSMRKEYAEPPVIDEPAPDLEIQIPLTGVRAGILAMGTGDTVGLESGDYYYDIHLVTAAGYVDTFINNRKFTLMPEVHGWA